jgi:hypothetical protein
MAQPDSWVQREALKAVVQCTELIHPVFDLMVAVADLLKSLDVDMPPKDGVAPQATERLVRRNSREGFWGCPPFKDAHALNGSAPVLSPRK